LEKITAVTDICATFRPKLDLFQKCLFVRISLYSNGRIHDGIRRRRRGRFAAAAGAIRARRFRWGGFAGLSASRPAEPDGSRETALRDAPAAGTTEAEGNPARPCAEGVSERTGRDQWLRAFVTPSRTAGIRNGAAGAISPAVRILQRRKFNLQT